MELLQRLTRRQLDTLLAVARLQSGAGGVPLGNIASQLKVRPPSALDHLTQLEGQGLVSRYRGKTVLTPQGRNTLDEYFRHHDVSERLFRQSGLSREESCRAAHEVDLAISQRTVQRVARMTRPSGDPEAHSLPLLPSAPRRGGH